MNIKLDIVDCLRHFWYTVFQELALLAYLRFLLYWQIYYFHFNISGDIWDQPWYLLNTRLWNELLRVAQKWLLQVFLHYSYVTSYFIEEGAMWKSSLHLVGWWPVLFWWILHFRSDPAFLLCHWFLLYLIAFYSSLSTCSANLCLNVSPIFMPGDSGFRWSSCLPVHFFLHWHGILCMKFFCLCISYFGLLFMNIRGQEWVGAIPPLPPSATMACSGTALLCFMNMLQDSIMCDLNVVCTPVFFWFCIGNVAELFEFQYHMHGTEHHDPVVNTPALYLGGPGSKYRSWQLAMLIELLCGLPSRQMLAYYLQLGSTTSYQMEARVAESV
jgi:hypothetical protein